MATFRVPFDEADKATTFRAMTPALAEELLTLGAARPDVTGAKTRETELRGMTRDDVFDAVVLIDGVGRRELETLMPGISAKLRSRRLKIDAAEAAIYDMAYCLEPTG